MTEIEIIDKNKLQIITVTPHQVTPQHPELRMKKYVLNSKGKLIQRLMQATTQEIRDVRYRVYRRMMGYALDP